MKRRITALAALLLAGLLMLTGCGKGTETQTAATKAPATAEEGTPAEAPAEKAAERDGPIIAPQEIADYLFEYGRLPDNFLTKDEAMMLGWEGGKNLAEYAPGMSIGGDRYGNYEGKLPKVKGRKYFECDCNYTWGKRNEERLVYSSDGHVWYSGDHYETFTELFPSK